MKTIGFIPARYASTRLPKKLLLPLENLSILEHTYLNAIKSSCFDQVIILTDHPEIESVAKKLNADVLLTPESCKNGTERIAYALENYNLASHQDCIVNIQADEPFLPADTFRFLINEFKANPCDIATLVCPVSMEDALKTSCVKCVTNTAGYAMYFSRSVIPGHKEPNTTRALLKHIGLYAYKKDFLVEISKLPNTFLQLTEDLEQLKALEYGYKIKVKVISQDVPHGIDTLEDYENAKRYICTRN